MRDTTPSSPASRHEHGASRLELDRLVVSVELTLLSIIEGVVLYVLLDASREPLLTAAFGAWPYIATGLLMIFLFWSRSVIHTFTLIRWPIEYGHNFLYIACAFFQGLMFSQVGRPLRWFLAGAALAGAGWILFAWDLRLIRNRYADDNGPAGLELLQRIRSEQLANLRLGMPAVLVFNLAAAAAIWRWPDAFLLRRGHLALAILQLAAVLAYQAWVIRWFRRIAPLVLRCRTEWQAAAENADPSAG